MNIENIPSKQKLLVSIMILFVGLMICYFYEYRKIYVSIDVVVSKSAIVEYGSPNYDIRTVLDSVDGDIISIKKDIDTTKVGPQEIIVEVEKDDVVKDVGVVVEVKDTVAPEIQLKDDTISFVEGESFDILSNLSSVYDKVDGELTYYEKENVDSDVDTDYYTVDSNVDSNVPGTYQVTVTAVDKYGNKSSANYSVEVVAKVEDEEEGKDLESTTTVNTSEYKNDSVASGDVNALVKLAYSLIGSPYVAGGTTPAGFDCSGFVQYLYSQIGISISRSSSTQMYDGVAVSYENAQPGDILIWGYSAGQPTHVALYVGNGQMIHATNPRQGVIASDVAYWTSGSGTHVIAVRRI